MIILCISMSIAVVKILEYIYLSLSELLVRRVGEYPKRGKLFLHLKDEEAKVF